jgi:hypothetical protein
MNSDYAMVRLREHKELSLSIPDNIEYSKPYDGDSPGYTLGTVSFVKANADDSVMVYFTSSRYDYSMIGRMGETVPEGSSFTMIGDPTSTVTYGPQIGFMVRQTGNTIKFEAWCPSMGGGPGVSFRYQGYAQTITAHVLTFKDPFSE